MESIFLNVEAVNTHREKPQVREGGIWGINYSPPNGGDTFWGEKIRFWGEHSPPTNTKLFAPQNVDVSRPPAEALITVPEHY